MIQDIYVIDDKNELIGVLNRLFVDTPKYRFIN